MKKLLSLILAVMMVISAFSVTALADGMDALDLVPIGEAAAPTEEPAEEPAEEPVQESEPAEEEPQGNAAESNLNEMMAVQNGQTFTIHAPAGSVVSFGTNASYSQHKFKEALSVESTEEGITAVFELPVNTEVFYRVQNPNGVTYWNFGKWNSSAEITVTEEELYIGSTEFTKDSIYRLEKNKCDVADIYLNINEKGCLPLQVGETKEINAVRNWQAIESFMNAKIAVPDVHYQVIDVNGNPSDVITITPNENKSMNATLTANHEGTAIVLVTYDAMIHMQAQGGGTQFSAIWPENTGVFVVTVGEDGSKIATNMTINEGLNTESGKLAVDALDAEHDVLYYLSDEGASYSFTPENGCEVTVMRPTLTPNAMTYSGGFTSAGVMVDSAGKVTINKLMHGTNIVKITKDGVSTYQLIRAKKAEVIITDSEGNSVEIGGNVDAGTTLKITYNGIYNPAEKLSGIYNFTARLFYVDENGNVTYSADKASAGSYNFASNAVQRTFTYKVSALYESGTLVLKGGIGISAYGQPVGGHRGKKDAGQDFNASYREALLGRLPDITLNVVGKDDMVNCEIRATDGINEINNVKYTVTNEAGDEATYTTNQFKLPVGTYTVKAFADGYVVLRNAEIDVSAESENKFTITLKKAGKNAWDGESFTAPKQDENGVWQISNAEELCWYIKESNANTISGQNAVLTADIELAGYDFTPLTKLQEAVFDGQGHTINNLYTTI